MSYQGRTLYTNGERYFIVPDDAEVAPGPLWMVDIAGTELALDPEEAVVYEVTEAEADAFIQAEVSETIPEVVAALRAFLMAALEVTTLPPEERRELRDGIQRTWEALRTDDPVGIAAFRLRTQRVARELEARGNPQVARMVWDLPDHLQKLFAQDEQG